MLLTRFQIWGQISSYTEIRNSLRVLSKKLKNWKSFDCPCRICKISVPNLGSILTILTITGVDLVHQSQQLVAVEYCHKQFCPVFFGRVLDPRFNYVYF